MEKGAEHFRTLLLRTCSTVLKIQKTITSTFSSSLGTLSVVSLSVKQNKTKLETQVILPAAAKSSSSSLIQFQQAEANRVKRNYQKTRGKHGPPVTAIAIQGLDSTDALNNSGKFTWLSQLAWLYPGKDSNGEERSRFVISGQKEKPLW